MYNSNNFILTISISKLKNIIDKNFDFIEIKNQNLIKIQLKKNNNYFLSNDEDNQDNQDNQDYQDNNSNEQNDLNNEDNNNIDKNVEQYDSNFFLNSFINVIDSYKFDIDDWQFIYKNDENKK